MLFLAVHLPTLPLDVYARAWSKEQHARPFIVSSGGRYPRVVAANAAARQAGIRRDQLISAALALAPEVALRDRDADAEAAALDGIATCALDFTSGASLAPPDAVIAEVGGSVRLFGGLAPLATRLRERVAAQGFTIVLGLAPTPFAALLLARAGASSAVLDHGTLAAALAPLALKHLDLDERVLDTLLSAGVETIGQAGQLPRDAFARRFGSALLDMLDRALGRIPDARAPYVPPPRFDRRLVLPAPVADTEALGFALNRFVHELCAWLAGRGLGATCLSLALVHERYLRARGLADTVVPFALGAPTRTPAHLHAVLRERLSRIALPSPVEAIALCAEDTVPLQGRNFGLLPEDEAQRSEVPLLDRLRARLGDDAVTLLATQAEHRPELATTQADLATVAGNTARMHPLQPIAGSSALRAADRRMPLPLPPAPRPVWLLSEPQPLNAVLQAQPWILRDGPERIESGWWDGCDLKRDYFVAENPQGEVVWIYRDHRYGTDDGEWFLHGVFG